jgi:hypothetical protein
MGKPLYLTFFTAIQMSHSSEVKLRESASTCSAAAVLETKDDGSKNTAADDDENSINFSIVDDLLTWHQVSKNRRQSLSKTDNNKQCFTNFTEWERNCSV